MIRSTLIVTLALLPLTMRAGLAQAPVTDAVAKPPALVAPEATQRSWVRPGQAAGASHLIMPALPIALLLAEDALQADGGPVRTGLVQDASTDSTRAGRWEQLQDGRWFWTCDVTATGAEGLRVRIEPWSPPGGAELFVSEPGVSESLHGPFGIEDGRSNERFWTPSLPGDTVRLEYALPLGVAPADAPLTVTGVLNRYRPIGGPGQGVLPCHLDVSCYPDWQFQADGVGALDFVGGGASFFCSGAMLNRIPGDFTPLFMTARHCGVNAGNADTLEVIWFYQSSSCNGSIPDPTTLPKTSGVVLLVDDAASDFTLVGLKDENLNGVTFLGWDANALGIATPVAGIHHPGGSFKRISIGTTLVNTISCVNGLSTAVVYLADDGQVEPGSSGSPVFDFANRRVRGTGSCATWDCGLGGGADYGRFDIAYSKLEPYLDPVSPVYANEQHGGNEEGTFLEPFDTLQEAVFAVAADDEIILVAGNYVETLTIDKPMTLTSLGVVTIGE